MNKLIPSKIFFLSLLFLYGCLLNGCATLQKPESPSNLSEKIQTTDHFMLEGQIGIQSAKTSGSASLNWAQDNDQYHIRLFGPLGLGSTQLIGNAHSIALINHQGQIFTAHSPEQLLQQQLGWTIPITPMIYWVRGLKAPNSPAQKEYNTHHQLTDLNQLSWTIQYLTYENNLPKLIQLDNKKARLKIFVHRWSTPRSQ